VIADTTGQARRDRRDPPGTCFCGRPIPSVCEAITTRPLLLEAIGRPTHHIGRTTLTIISTHDSATALARRLLGSQRRRLQAV
jgi:hypothetical protein